MAEDVFQLIDCFKDYQEEFCNTKPKLQIFRRGKHFSSIPLRELQDTDAIVARLLHIYYDQVVAKISNQEELKKLILDNIEANMDIFIGYFSKFYTRAHRMFFESFPTFKESYKFVIITNITLIHRQLDPVMPLDYVYKIYHCNDTLHRTNQSCPHTYHSEYFSSHELFLFMQRNKLPIYTELIHQDNLTIYNQNDVNKIFIFAESHQYERIIQDVQDFGSEYSGKIGFLIANMSNLDEKADLPVKWYKIKEFPAVYAQRAGADRDTHKMLGNYTARNLKYFVDEYWKRVGVGVKTEKADMDVESITKEKHDNITTGKEKKINYAIFYCPGPVSCDYWEIVLGRVKRSFITHPEFDVVTYLYSSDKDVPQETNLRFVSIKGKVNIFSKTKDFTYEGILDFIEEETLTDFTRLPPTAGDHFEPPKRLSNSKADINNIDDEIAKDIKRIYESDEQDPQAERYKRQSSVTSLTDKTIQEFINQNGIRIINYYTTWDIRSRAFSFIYEDIKLKFEQNPTRMKLSFAEINCADYPRPCEANGITEYPTVKVYTENNDGVVYKGSFTIDSLIAGIKIYTEESNGKFTSVEQGQKFLENASGVVVIGLFEKPSVEFDEVMKRFSGIMQFGRSFQSDISMALAEKLNIKLPAVICYKATNEVKRQIVYEGELTVDGIETFIYNNGLPLFDQFSEHNFINYFRSKKPLVSFILHGHDAEAIQKEIVNRLSGSIYSNINVAWMDLDDVVTQSIIYYYTRGNTDAVPRCIYVDRRKGIANTFIDKEESPEISNIEKWINKTLHANMKDIIQMGGVHLADRDWLPKQEALDFLTLEKRDNLKKDFNVESAVDIREYLEKNDVYNPRRNIAWFGDDEGLIIDGTNIGPLTKEKKEAITGNSKEVDNDDEGGDEDDEEDDEDDEQPESNRKDDQQPQDNKKDEL
ncbi:uncharacterized protein TRIADDRAFT_60230 [Trichoplax adhaerens]|uniref:Thioredoxin domain-containing protein n=1 Tax=Trichoplax adhaerens TaxID=10228 RepID=B3S7N1_TRIAD|nr:hypothetical protein TRIADDRAFT_60230 [Trichoplax adhaerens]EDV21318.1 hypothetical protein TRIADDRAFT_60230 [Trichoplax adhaerens]|eukprot:XP_002116285.1 hypothetical protein TRIADDRAFT_60230 [Trichoplax adhaerens]